MPKFKNISPLGALDIPALGRAVESGEVFEVPAALSSVFVAQTANFKQIKQQTKPKGAKDAPTDESGEAGESTEGASK